ncbi:PREDICTED: ubiquitin carboxyl-terminal hydrolase 47-like isoform X1 [Amphimedon queenslandica]|nr:PREDICTED: ubiquitin carboxyl-terminal hydrolase 47-like isoform X1 [Amphimedon queenslandica]|eukprot:XP_019853466.1 PREDICTED: ubiquitin carboxyl-terminal hydrolase 47-like isoform X1 [Amphimedon queenslandica]
MNMELMTEREHNEKIIKDIKDLKEIEDEKRQREKKQKIEEEILEFSLYCNHPVTGELMESKLKVHKDELLPSVLDKAYELIELAPHIPIDRCRLVEYDYKNKVMGQSFHEFQHQTIGQIVGRAGDYCLFLETRTENETFKKYNYGGINLKVSVVDLSTGEVGPAKLVRGELGWTVEELKEHIGELLNIKSSCMRIVLEEDYRSDSVHDISDIGDTLRDILIISPYIYEQLYVSSDPKDYQKEFKNSLMYKYVDFHVSSILLNIILPPAPGPEATPTTTIVTKRGIIMKIISMNEENKGKERKIQVQVDKRITLAQLKEELVPLIGVPPTGFIVYGISGYEMQGLGGALKYMYIRSGSELIIRLGRGLGRGEVIIKLYLFQVNNTEFCNFMMESIVTKDTTVREFKKQVIEEAKVQGIDCVLELDKMRLRDKIRVSPGRLYFNHELIDSREMYVEPLKGPEKKRHYGQIQVYVIRWRPSQCSVDPIEEIILDKYDDPKHVIGKLSELSEVPAEYIYCTEGQSFPVDRSCLHIENYLDWYSISSGRYSLGLYHSDGYVIYYKDNRERMKELTDEERSGIQEAEEARLKKIGECKSKH